MIQVRETKYDFRGHNVIPLTASSDGSPWVKAVTGAGGPTCQTGSTGLMELTLEATSEVQNMCLYFGNVLPFDLDDLAYFEMLLMAPAALDAATTITMGLASARNDDPDAIAQAALWKLAGNNTLVVESDDGTINNDDKGTDLTLTNTLRRLKIDFTGVLTRMPPQKSLGGKGNVRFFGEDSGGIMRQVAGNTLFEMSNYAGGLQPYFQIQKTANTNTDKLSIAEVVVGHRIQS